MNRIFLDINIVIDLIDENRKLHIKAKNSLLKIIDENFEIYVSEDMLTTIYYILKGNLKVLNFFEFILEKWNVVGFGKDIIKDSIIFSKKYNSDLEDTLQCLCAKNNNCKILLTNDKNFIKCGLNILNYDEFLKDKNV